MKLASFSFSVFFSLLLYIHMTNASVLVVVVQVYIPLYVQDTLHLPESYVATVPFSMYLAGFAGSLVMKEINKKIGRKVSKEVKTFSSISLLNTFCQGTAPSFVIRVT